MNISVDYTNTQITELINEHIHSERDRAILRRRLVDGVCYQDLADEFDRTPRQMQRVVDKLQKELFKYLD